MSSLPADAAARFARDGYLVLPGFASGAEVAALLRRGAELLAAADPEAHASVFSTKRQTDTTDEYFLQSGNNISVFLEDGALDARTGRLAVPKALAVNKLGHAMHDLDDVFRAFSRADKVPRDARGHAHAPGSARRTAQHRG